MTSCGETVSVPTNGPFAGQLCGIAQCFPLDAATLDALDGSAGPDPASLTRAQCDALCQGTQSWQSCAPIMDGGVPLIECQPFLCLGRRPEGLASSAVAVRGTGLGAHFAESARLEAASVHAFRHLRRELLSYGAPLRLVRAAERAARDEVRHARVAAAFARRHGWTPVAPEVETRPVRALEAIALENAVEGCAREAFGALVATWQAAVARDPEIRAAMASIARDETRHAALAFAVDAWLGGRLDSNARGRVDQARRDALAELAGASMDVPEGLRGALGLPSGVQARALAEGMQPPVA